MKKLLNTLYITTEDTYLHIENDTIIICREGFDKVRMPAIMIESIVCFGNTTVSTPLLAFCSRHCIALSFHSEYGKFYSRLHGAVSGNVPLRKSQFTLPDSKASDFVKNVLVSKIQNSRYTLMKSARDIENDRDKAELIHLSDLLAKAAGELVDTEDIEVMRGIEGAAAQSYFRGFDLMLKTDDPLLKFERRSKRPPGNRVNALLSFLYMLLKNDVQSALESVGLDPACGYLHTQRPGRPSLALDLMEEFRSVLCDRLVISLINTKQVTAADFESFDCEYHIKEKPRKLLLETWTKRKREVILHPYMEEKIAIGLIPYAQAMLMARYLRGDIEMYPPFLWR